MAKKAKCKILFDGGDYNLKKPGTFLVRLRRWQHHDMTDYVLETTIITEKPRIVPAGVRLTMLSKELYAETEIKRILDCNDDAEAIVEASTEYQKRKNFFTKGTGQDNPGTTAVVITKSPGAA